MKGELWLGQGEKPRRWCRRISERSFLAVFEWELERSVWVVPGKLSNSSTTYYITESSVFLLVPLDGLSIPSICVMTVVKEGQKVFRVDESELCLGQGGKPRRRRRRICERSSWLSLIGGWSDAFGSCQESFPTAVLCSTSRKGKFP